ncbi:MAG: sensor histidine kinase [Burkholderiales bacterium]
MLLLGPLVALSAVSGFISYRVSIDATSTAFDRSLLDPAIAFSRYVDVVGREVRFELPAGVLDALQTDATDQMSFRVFHPDGSPLDGNAPMKLIARESPNVHHKYFDTDVDGEPMRAVALFVPTKAGIVTVQVAETLLKRRALVREVFSATVLPEVVVIATAIAMFAFAIRRGLAPLERLRGEIEQRSPEDLRPVSEIDAPDEVRPLVHELNQLLDRLRGALASQQQFIGNAAHQLRTPLAGLSAHAELALREPSSDQLRGLLESVHSETKRTAHLVNQLLTLARSEPGGAINTSRVPVNLEQTASESAQAWVQRALTREIDLGFELEPAWTVGETLLLRELLANLVDNAITYTARGGSVTVRTTMGDASAVLAVEDNGPGIAAAERERVGQRFYRVPGTPGDGCGLGLAIVYDIAARHGARVYIDTGPSGVGTTVRVEFPRLRPDTRIGEVIPLRPSGQLPPSLAAKPREGGRAGSG